MIDFRNRGGVIMRMRSAVSHIHVSYPAVHTQKTLNHK
jgi:hypothetical protein